MQDLRLLAVEQDFIVLEGANGEKFRLALDEALRKAVRSDKGIRVETDAVTPREIQELVRSGHSVEEISSKTGASYSYVEKFATPVLEELDHIVNSAQSVRLSFLGERYGETNHIEFGVLIRERLNKLGADSVRWMAKRTETGGCQVSCSFVIDGETKEAKWSFDLRYQSLSPDNEVALNLASNPQADALVPKLSPVASQFATSPAAAPILKSGSTTDFQSGKSNITPAPESNTVKNLTSSLGETQEFADVIPFGRGRNNTAQLPVVAAGTSTEIDSPQPPEIDDSEDLLDGLRRRRDLRESLTGVTPIVPIADFDCDADAQNGVELEGDVEFDAQGDFDETTVWIETSDEVLVEKNPTPPTRRGRATMPSWDEIVFGTKPDSKDD